MRVSTMNGIQLFAIVLRRRVLVDHVRCGLIVFAHGSGSSRLSPRNLSVARALNEVGLATLLVDLLLPSEAEDRHKVFDIPLLASRLEEALDWVEEEESTSVHGH